MADEGLVPVLFVRALEQASPPALASSTVSAQAGGSERLGGAPRGLASPDPNDAPWPWTQAQADAATREAFRQLGGGASPLALLADRARRLLGPWAAALPVPGLGARGAWVAAAVLLVAALGGLMMDTWASGQRLQLLSMPLVGLVLWNLGVYAGLVARAAWAWLGRAPRPARPGGRGALPPGGAADRRPGMAAGLLLWLHGRAVAHTSVLVTQPLPGSAAQARTQAWLEALALHRPVLQRRALALVHAAAAVLAGGVVASMYARGLVLDFRAGWESTFLDASAVRQVLAVLLAPAAVWPGLALPDASVIDGLRWPLGAVAAGGHAANAVPLGHAPGADAAPWIHRWALALAGWVVLPRGLLAVLAWRRASWRQAAGLLPLHEPYFQQLLRDPDARARPVPVLPYNCRLAPGGEPALARALAVLIGPGAQPALSASLPLGAEDDLPKGLPEWPPDAPALVVLMNLNATPEREAHGAFLRLLRPHVPPALPVHLLLDRSAFMARLAGQPDAAVRLAQRHAAWRQLAELAGVPPPHLADLADLAGPWTGQGAAPLSQPADARLAGAGDEPREQRP